MAIGKKEGEQKQRQSEMEMKLKAMQCETELADFRDQTSLKNWEMRLQIKEAEGFCHGSTVSPSLMSLSTDEDKNSYVKIWLDQNSIVMDIQKQNSPNDVKTAKGNSVFSGNPAASRRRGQPPREKILLPSTKADG